MSEADEIRELVREIARASSDAPPSEFWAGLQDAGLAGVGLEESRGGSGGTLADLAAIVSEVAAAGISAPLVENHVGQWLISGQREIVPGLVTIVDDGSFAIDEEGRLHGTAARVRWAQSADWIVVSGPSLEVPCLIEATADGLVIAPVDDLAGEDCGSIVASGVETIALRKSATQAARESRVAVLRAAALAGACAGTFAMTKRYVNERVQFGAPLARLGPVAAGVATLSVLALQARTALENALWQEHDVDEASAAAARIITSRSASESVKIAHQLHGAMGVTAEYPLHRLTLRVWSWRDADLPEREWLRRLGEHVAGENDSALWEIGSR